MVLQPLIFSYLLYLADPPRPLPELTKKTQTNNLRAT